MVKKKEENKEKSIADIIADEAVKKMKSGEIKGGADFMSFFDGLIQPILQKCLDTELAMHLDYSKYEHKKDSNNSRNGHCKSKTVKTDHGSVVLKTPRDRNSTFAPILIEKGQTSFPGFEEKCVALYAKGMSLRDIEKILTEMYGVKINKESISVLISAVSEEVEKWRARQLQPLYVFAYADCLYVPIKDDLTSEKKAIYVIIGVDSTGHKDILGMWTNKTESANFWCNVFTDLKERGVKDILYVCSDGIAGFKNSLETVFPKTLAQRCVVHLVRNLYALCPRKDAKSIIADFKKIYTSTSLDTAMVYLDDFKTKYSEQKKIIKKVEEYMQYLEPLFELPIEIRKCIYTTNAIESVNSALRKVTRGKGAFPNEESLYKVLYLRIKELKEKWNKPIQSWGKIQAQLIELHGERYTKYIKI